MKKTVTTTTEDSEVAHLARKRSTDSAISSDDNLELGRTKRQRRARDWGADMELYTDGIAFHTFECSFGGVQA